MTTKGMQLCRNPFFIRSVFPTIILMASGDICTVSRNPFFIRSVFPTTQLLH